MGVSRGGFEGNRVNDIVRAAVTGGILDDIGGIVCCPTACNAAVKRAIGNEISLHGRSSAA
ncbi:hypothetical protein D3C72_2100670 [compost metagenome]